MRELVTEDPIEKFLAPGQLIDFENSAITQYVDGNLRGLEPVDAARTAFHFVRDEVSHSWDIQGRRVTRSASDVLKYREGICYAKSHLLAAILRCAKIPTGICYQRLTLFDDESSGYAVHALNTVYLESVNRWIRLDARGNKPGVDAQFLLDGEQLAFKVRPQYDEVDYLYNHSSPHPLIVEALMNNDDAILMYRNNLPQFL